MIWEENPRPEASQAVSQKGYKVGSGQVGWEARLVLGMRHIFPGTNFACVEGDDR